MSAYLINYIFYKNLRTFYVKSLLTILLNDRHLEAGFTMSLMRGVEEAASKRRLSGFLCNSYGDMERERKHLDVLLAKQVYVIVILSGYRVRQRGAPAPPLVVYVYQYT